MMWQAACNRTNTIPKRPSVFLLLIPFCLLIICISHSPFIIASTLDEQRQLYLDAKQHFRKKQLKSYQSLKKQLKNYPLTPYLDYSEIISKLAKWPYAEVDSFLSNHGNSYLGNALRKRWLRQLASSKRWKDFLYYYHNDVNNTALRCLYIEQNLLRNKTYKPKDIESIWLSGKSQPDECDNVFSHWTKQGYLTRDLLWERHRLALKRNNSSLALYLRRRMPASLKSLAELYSQVHNSPLQVRVVKTAPTPKAQDVVYNGIYRYAHSKPLNALSILEDNKKGYNLPDDRYNKLLDRIARKMVEKDYLDDAQKLIKKIPRNQREQSLPRLLRELLKQQNWAQIYFWVSELPEELQQEERWLYWKARSLEQLSQLPVNQLPEEIKDAEEEYRAIYFQLSQKRDFYGFLSADKVKRDYFFENTPSNVSIQAIEKVRTLPGLQRARELFKLGDMHRARNEWRYSIRDFNNENLVAAGQLAHIWGWHRKTIEVMAKAGYWNDLSLRFPIAHSESITRSAQARQLPPSLIYAIARQESAWEFDAQSRVGARGLMQIMPATAQETAKKSGLPYSRQRLYDPEYNITLGSHYISQLLRRFDNYRPLAIAAYNAGPHRVKTWLKRSQSQLPTDVWIEVIPFNETRKYVQNVLSYQLIYDYRRGEESDLLTSREKQALF